VNPIIELAITELPTAEQLPACHKTIEKLLGDVLIRDQYALRQRLEKIKVRADKGLPFTQDAQRFLDKITASLKTVALRKSSFPSIQYPEALPVAACRDQIAEAIQQHQVVIIAGETG
jgi:ATP-dependent helicase HrpA